MLHEAEAPSIGDQSKQLSGLKGQHLWGCIGVLLRGFVVAFLAIGIIAGRRLIAGLPRMIVVMCRRTPAWLHVFTPITSSRSAVLLGL